MSQNELAHKIEEIQVETEKIHSLQIALEEAVTHGEASPEDYVWAFSALGDITFTVKRELESIRDELFEAMKTDKQCKCPYR